MTLGKLLFCGVVSEVTLKHSQGVCSLFLKAYTYTIKLDIKKKKRSFQDKKAPYKKLFEKIIKEDAGGDFLDHATQGKAQEKVFIQYDETDWAFLKRVASQVDAVLLPDVLGDKPRVFIGLPKLGSGEEETAYNHSIEKALDRYKYRAENATEKSELEHITFTIKSDTPYDIGQDILYENKNLTVVGQRIVGRKTLVEKYYTLQKREGVYENPLKNQTLIGLALEGKVLAVQKDQIKVHLEIDQTQPLETANWFQLSTAYTSEGTTGFYVMPQIGDSLKLFIPEAEEDTAFIKTISRTDGQKNPKTADPKIKYLGTIAGKEMKLAPEELLITAKTGKLFISMKDKEGISIESDEEILIKSEGDITLKGKKISMTAATEIYLKGGDSTTVMDNLTHFKGKKITYNGYLKS